MKINFLRYFLIVGFLGFVAYVYYLVLRDPYFWPPVMVIGPVILHWYGISIVSAIATSVYFLNRLFNEYLSKDEQKKFDLYKLFIWVVVWGIIGARIYHLITDWHYYEGNPIAAFYIWNGGLGIYGGIAFGLIALYLYCKNERLNFAKLVDLIAVALPLGQIIGRFGNLFNRELLGNVTNLPWGVVLPIPGPANIFHPTFLYEQFGNLLLLALLLWLLGTKKLRIGSMNFFRIYIVGYALVRFFVDFFRTEPKVLFSLFTTAQSISLLVVLIFLLYLLRSLMQPLLVKRYRRM